MRANSIAAKGSEVGEGSTSSRCPAACSRTQVAVLALATAALGCGLSGCAARARPNDIGAEIAELREVERDLRDEIAALRSDLARLTAAFEAAAAADDVALGIDGAEIAAGGDVVGFELEADAGGLQRPAGDEVLDRVVAEESNVGRSGAGCYSRGQRVVKTADPSPCERIQVGGAGRL